MKLEVSIIIPTRNRKTLLELCLASLLRQNYPKNRYEIIIADGSRQSRASDLFHKGIKGFNIKYIHQPADESDFRAGLLRNVGARQARGRILIFLDCDMIATPDLIGEHLKYHSEENVLVLGYRYSLNKISAPILKEIISEKMYEEMYSLPMFPDLRENSEVYRNLGEDLFKFPYSWTLFSSCNFSVSRKKFNEIGAFDASFSGWGGEDLEFAYRAQKVGLIFFFARQIVSFHQAHERNIPKSLKSLYDNKIVMRRKYDDPELEGLLRDLSYWRENGEIVNYHRQKLASGIGARLIEINCAEKVTEKYLVYGALSEKIKNIIGKKKSGSMKENKVNYLGPLVPHSDNYFEVVYLNKYLSHFNDNYSLLILTESLRTGRKVVVTECNVDGNEGIAALRKVCMAFSSSCIDVKEHSAGPEVVFELSKNAEDLSGPKLNFELVTLNDNSFQANFIKELLLALNNLSLSCNLQTSFNGFWQINDKSTLAKLYGYYTNWVSSDPFRLIYVNQDNELSRERIKPGFNIYWFPIHNWLIGEPNSGNLEILREFYGLVWVPTKEEKERLISCGFPGELIDVIPYGIDSSRYKGSHNYAGEKQKSGRFTFFINASQRFDYCCETDLIFESFIGAFTKDDNVSLIIGIDSNNGSDLIKNTINKLTVKKGVNYPFIEYMEINSDQAKSPEFYSRFDAFIQLNSNAAFKYDALLALACAKTLIVADNTRGIDYFAEKFGYVIKTHLLRSKRPSKVKAVNLTAKAADPTEDKLACAAFIIEAKKVFHQVYKNPGLAFKKAELAADKIRQGYDHEVIGGKIKASVETYFERLAKNRVFLFDYNIKITRALCERLFFDEALRYLLAAEKLRPQNAWVKYLFALICYEFGNYPKAQTYLKAIKVSDDKGLVFKIKLLSGDIEYQLMRKPLAKKYYEQAIWASTLNGEASLISKIMFPHKKPVRTKMEKGQNI